jgi:RNA polymerase sigma-70 factor (ECF subfamily)
MPSASGQEGLIMAAIKPTSDLDPTDEQLMVRVCRDDAAAFATLVHRYERELFAFLHRYLHRRELAEDVFQASFLQVHRHRSRFEAGRPFRPWLYAIALRQAIDAHRKDARHRRVSLDGHTGAAGDGGSLAATVAGRESAADVEIERQEDRAMIRAAVEQLPELLRKPLELVYQRGLKYRDAAGILGVPVGTVKSRIHAAVARLQGAGSLLPLRPVPVAVPHRL